MAQSYLGALKALAGKPGAILPSSLARLMFSDHGGNHGLGFFVGERPIRFGHNDWHAGFCAVTVAFGSGESTVILTNSDPEVDAPPTRSRAPSVGDTTGSVTLRRSGIAAGRPG